MKSVVDSGDRREVVVEIDGNGSSSGNNNDDSRDCQPFVDSNIGSKIWRESSYDFGSDGGPMAGKGGNASKSDGFKFQQRSPGVDDPPSKLIGQFLHKQRASGEISLDTDLEMDELRRDRGPPPVAAESPTIRQLCSRELKVAPEPVRRRYKESPGEEGHQHNQGSSNLGDDGGGGVGEVVVCTSNASFRRGSSLLKTKTKTKSRLLDPPPEEPDGESGILNNNDEEEDPFLVEDLPEEFKKEKLSLLTVLQWVILILIGAALACSLTIPVLKKWTIWQLHLWKWEVLILVLICGRLVSGWGIRIAVFFIERNFLLRKRVLYFVYGVRKAVQNCLWLGLVLIAWHSMLDKKVEKELHRKTLSYVTKILLCLLLGTLIWLLTTIVVKALASSFHVSTFFDRIQESLFNQYVIETLSGPPSIEILYAQEKDERVMAEVQKLQNAGTTMPAHLNATAFPTYKSRRVIGSGGLKSPSGIKNFRSSGPVSKKQDERITIDHLHKLNPKNVSAWNMKMLMKTVRHGVLSTQDEQILDSTDRDESAVQIRSESQAKAATKKIFHNVAKLGSKYFYQEDLMRFMREDEALKTMSLFEVVTEDKRISKSALQNWVANTFRERRALALTLNDTKTLANTIHHMVNIVVAIIILIIWLLVLGIATTQFLVFISSQLLLVVFVIGSACKTTFEAIIFLFVMHPFDVGDRCEVDAVQMVVEEINILTTVFLRYDNQKIIYPNSVLATKPISNYYRSPDMGDAIDFCIHISTPMEKIAIMKERITGYIERKKDHWYPAPMIVLRDVKDMNRLTISVWLTHRMNHQEMGERWERRALLVEEMIKIFRELNMEYRMLPFDVNVQNMPTWTSTRIPSNWSTCAN